MLTKDLGSWQGWPYDTTRTGTFLTGVQSVGVWFLLGNAEAISHVTGRYVRPNGSVAFTTDRFSVNGSYRNLIGPRQYFDPSSRSDRQ